MARVGGSRKRGLILATTIGGIALVVLAIVLSGSLPAGRTRSADAAASTGTRAEKSDPTSCTQFQAMVHSCPDPTSTTTSTTGAPLTPQTSGPGASGGGTTTYYSTPGRSAPTPTTTAPPAGPSANAAGSPTVASNPAACSGSTPPVGAPTGSWHCTFDDEFNGSSLDPTKWTPQTTAASGSTTGTLLNEVCYINSPQTISESGGYLHLTVLEQSDPADCGVGDYPAIGGEVMSYKLFSQQYGFFEASAQMPNVTTPGEQDTLWLYPENENLYGPWPASGEIDFGEWYSNLSANDYPVNHFPGDQNDPNSKIDNGCTIAGQTPAGQFHTYALMWTPTTLTEYYDGKVCLSDTYGPYVAYPDAAPAPFNQPFFMVLTAALGGAFGDEYQNGTPLPATFNIDWVRAWQYGP